MSIQANIWQFQGSVRMMASDERGRERGVQEEEDQEDEDDDEDEAGEEEQQ